MNSPVNNAAEPAHSSRFREAYEATAAERERLKVEDLVPVNLDVSKCVTTVLGSLPEIEALRPAILESLLRYDLQHFDKVETYALATGYVHALYLASSKSKSFTTELVAAAIKEREVLAADIEALAVRKLLDASGVPALRGDGSHRAIAFQVLGLVALLRKHWPELAGKTACQPADLDRAVKVADELVVAVGLREQAPDAIEAVAQERQRAFTLMLATYNQVRRAITYLRWDQDDADTIAPSLYSGRTSETRRNRPSAMAPPLNAPLPKDLPAQAIEVAPGLPNSPSFTVG